MKKLFFILWKLLFVPLLVTAQSHYPVVSLGDKGDTLITLSLAQLHFVNNGFVTLTEQARRIENKNIQIDTLLAQITEVKKANAMQRRELMIREVRIVNFAAAIADKEETIAIEHARMAVIKTWRW